MVIRWVIASWVSCCEFSEGHDVVDGVCEARASGVFAEWVGLPVLADGVGHASVVVAGGVCAALPWFAAGAGFAFGGWFAAACAGSGWREGH